jgi:hypothetical protein
MLMRKCEMAGNTLQAMLDRAKTAPEAASPKTRTKAITKAVAADQVKSKTKPSRAATKLIGGHFAPEVSMQLRIIAAEDDTTIQNLLAEALDDLFVKKGKARIAGV